MLLMVVTVVSDDALWRETLERELAERGFEALPLPADDAPARLPLKAKPTALILDAAISPYGATELAAQLQVFLEDRCPALVCAGEPPESDDGDLFDGVVSRLSALDELVQLLPRLRGVSGFVSRADVVIPDDVEIG
jgi:hypothetical protein